LEEGLDASESAGTQRDVDIQILKGVWRRDCDRMCDCVGYHNPNLCVCGLSWSDAQAHLR